MHTFSNVAIYIGKIIVFYMLQNPLEKSLPTTQEGAITLSAQEIEDCLKNDKDIKITLDNDSTKTIWLKIHVTYQKTDETSNKTVNNAKHAKENLTKKPERPCILCEDLVCFTNLRRHQIRKHKDSVKHILKLPPKQQDIEFKKLRLRGVKEYNKRKKIRQGKNFVLHRARRSKNEAVVKMCSLCNIFVSKATFYRHKCVQASPFKKSVCVDALPAIEALPLNEQYLIECINTISDDEPGLLVKETPTILYLGEKLYLQTNDSKKVQRKRRVGGFLRKMGLIFHYFRKNISPNFNFIDMFSARNIDAMKDAILHCISNGKTQGPMFANAVKFCCNKLSSKAFASGDDDLSSKYERYSRCFSDMYRESFKNISDNLLREKYRQSRDPKNLAKKEDIDIILSYCDDSLNRPRTIAEFGKNYIEIRRSLATILTIENSRRGKYLLNLYHFKSFKYIFY